ncbi:MAG: hypothetical protein Tsb0014_21210 [Pleurocapsa sp.]
MKMNHKFCTNIALALLGFSPILWNSSPAHAVTGSLSIDNTDFTVIQNFGVNNAPGDSTIDNTAISDGFGDQFSDTGGNTFLLLGASDPTSTINGGTNAGQEDGNSVATSTTFEITQDNIDNGLDVSFDWAFQGNGSAFDEFVVAITNSSFTEFKELINQDSYGSGTVDQSFDISSLSTGTDYMLYVAVNEANNFGNSAAGFDNISVAPTPPVGVPFEFSPTLGLLIMGGLFGGSSYLKRRRLSANIDLS